MQSNVLFGVGEQNVEKERKTNPGGKKIPTHRSYAAAEYCKKRESVET